MTSFPMVRHVKMAELARGEGPGLLKATLGSCVGIAIWWPEARRAGLAHCLLPDSALDTDAREDRVRGMASARYVDVAVPALLGALGASRGDFGRLKAYLAGGASLRRGGTPVLPTLRVGELNVRAARSLLRRTGVAIVAEQVGGHDALQITIDCATGTVSITRIEAPD